MVVGRVAQIVSAAATRFSAKSSSTPYASPDLPPLPGSTGEKNFLRLSSSLQDFSTYDRLDPESAFSPPVPRNGNNDKQPILLRETAGSSFSKEKVPPGVPKRRKWMCVIITLICLLLVALFLYWSHFSYFNWSHGTVKYYVVLDCGSTGTRIYVYQASINHNKDNSLPIIVRSLPEGPLRKSSSQSGRAYNRMETEPGFDKLVHNISGLRGAIKPLVQWAEKQIPKSAYKETSLFLYATAGLRRLPKSDSEWLLNNAWSILKNSHFVCKKEWIKIISGTDEAYYGWIALNYSNGTLGAIPDRKTLGALDMGGSSLQVTFESKENNNEATSLRLRIGNVNHHLTAYSMSGYGLNDAFDKSVVHLVKRLPKITNANLLSGKVEIKHPCLNLGYKEQYTCSHCTNVLQQGGSPTAEARTSEKGRKPSVLLTGAPNWDDCRALAKVAVNLSEWSDHIPGIDCRLQPCALSENYPRPYGKFNAMSGFYVVYRFFNLTPEASLDDVLEKGQEFCEKRWDDAKSSVRPQPFIEQYCFRAPYIVLLLRDGLRIADGDVTIGSGSITWTLGVALSEAGKAVSSRIVFHGYELLRMKISPVILFGVLFVSLFILVCALFCIGSSTSKYFHRPYLPLFRHSSSSSTPVLNIPAPFRFQRWSPISSGDGRVKMPLSPTVANTRANPFDSSGIQLTQSSLYRSSTGVTHSYSSDSLRQMQFDSSTIGSFWMPHGSQMRLQSRRSQSREDLSSSLAEAHIAKI